MLSILAVVVSLCLTTSAFANPAAKLGPGLKMSLLNSQSGTATKPADQTISVLVKGHSAAVRSAIREAGGHPGTSIVDITTARVRVSSLESLANHPSVERIERAKPKRLRNTQAAVHTGAKKAHDAISPLPQSYTGKGVIVGIIDSGIDWRHRDFRDPADSTKTRILAIWDMDDNTGPAPEGFAYGTVWTQEQINAALRGEGTVQQIDTNGHGTHVAGSAVGNGSATGSHRGMAYEADIVVVKGQNEVDGSSFVFVMADTQSKPAVINFSQGTHFGPHDGTSMEEQAVNALVQAKTGRVFVTAAGNEGESFVHWGGFALSADSAWTYYHYNLGTSPEPNGSDFSGVMEMYSLVKDTDPASTFIGVGVDSTDYTEFAGFVNPRGHHGMGPWYRLSELSDLADGRSDTLRYTNGEAAGVVSVTAQLLSSGKVGIQLTIEDFITSFDNSGDYQAVGADLWRFMARGSGTVHVWSEGVLTAEHPDVQLEVTDAGYRPSDNAYSVGLPATASEVITVGAFTNVSVAGETATQGALAAFSSIGPTTDGRIKPDIVSPGENVISARSADFDPDPNLLTSDGLYYRESGTSMASPITAGAIALYLQRYPTASYSDIKTLMAAQAATDTHTSSAGALPNSNWGPGKLDIFAMLTNGPADGGTTIPTDTIARSDFSGNGTVDFTDFLTFVTAFGSRTGASKYDARIDLDDNGEIGFSDFLIFTQAFGQTVSS